MSHIELWRNIRDRAKPATICEDDALFHHQFTEISKRLISQLEGNWDLVLWGWNFDSVLVAEIPKLSPVYMGFDQKLMRLNTPQYRQSGISPTLLKLSKAFGTVCYSISPNGAKKFIDNVLPIRKMDVFYPLLEQYFTNSGIDNMMNNFYPQFNCLVAFPPLVITPHEGRLTSF